MSEAIKRVKNKRLDSTRKIRAALSRTNSLTVSVLIDLYSRGLTERQACELLNINYKLYRYTLDSTPTLSNIIELFNRARGYKTTRQHETVIRKTIIKSRV